MKQFFWIGTLLLASACSSTPKASPTLVLSTARSTPETVLASKPTEFIPSPTATQLAPKRYFTDNFDTAPTYWSILTASGDSGRVNILNKKGALIFELNEQNAWLYTIYGAFEYENVHIETKFESQANDVTSIGLVCNYDEQAGWYEFNISSDGTYSVLYGQWLAEGIAQYIPIRNDASERIQIGKATNEIGLDCYEDTLQLYINGKLIRKLDVAHIGLKSGKVGISLASFDETPVILTFDWVKVSEFKSP
ncbi:MAG: hypothetical protein QGD88_03050 [Anaerolineae bacterium]|nr:hypothetical protein [Anaerolineae bacterium]